MKWETVSMCLKKLESTYMGRNDRKLLTGNVYLLSNRTNIQCSIETRRRPKHDLPPEETRFKNTFTCNDSAQKEKKQKGSDTVGMTLTIISYKVRFKCLPFK